jgi:uncharacterized protein (TIGR00730 family)
MMSGRNGGRVIVLAGGSADHGPTRYSRAARAFGRAVAREGWTLRTGGGSGESVMGAAADGALRAGGRVEGVILRKFWGVRHRGMPLRSVGTFALRKAGLFRGADAAVVFPGGYGTLDELGDLLALKQTGFVRIPIVLLNLAGYCAGLLAWDRHAAREGFLYGGRLFEVAATPSGAVGRCRAAFDAL